MSRNHPPARRTRVLTVALTAAAAGASTLMLIAANSSTAGGSLVAVPPPPPVPTSADEIQNIDQVKTAIKGYYGDTLTTKIDPVPNDIDGGDKVLHTFNPAGNYAAEVGGIVTDAKSYLKAHSAAGTKQAILLDVDDTTLNTYSYEIYSNFVYNPTTNAAFVNATVFPAVPHMVELEKYASAKHYAIFFLTGRPESQRVGTELNLTDEGYSVNSHHLFLKDYTVDTWLAPCAPACTTTQYKSLTRQHIEQDLGYNIAANFGDQFSDLNGGFADQTFKLPNPMYFLP